MELTDADLASASRGNVAAEKRVIETHKLNIISKNQMAGRSGV